MDRETKSATLGLLPRPGKALARANISGPNMSNPQATNRNDSSSEMRVILATPGLPPMHGKAAAGVHISEPPYVDPSRNEQTRSISQTAKPDSMRLCDYKLQFMEPKRAKRILSDRESGRRQREKKNKYCARLESEAKKLQEDRGMIKYLVEFYQRVKKSLQAENDMLKEKVARAKEVEASKTVQYEWIKREKKRLLDLQMQQQQNLVILHQHPYSGNESGNTSDFAVVLDHPVIADDLGNNLELPNHEDQESIISDENFSVENLDTTKLDELIEDMEGILKGVSHLDPVDNGY